MGTDLVCIVCPMGCRLSVNTENGGELSVTGNRCPRGAAYAREELLAPKRVVTATCAVSGFRDADPSVELPRRLACRTSAAFPREQVPELLTMIYALEAAIPIVRGQVLIKNALDSGVDVIATRTLR